MTDPVPLPPDAHERLTRLLAEARVAGGWSDEDVAWNVLDTLGLDADGKAVEPDAPPGDA